MEASLEGGGAKKEEMLLQQTRAARNRFESSLPRKIRTRNGGGIVDELKRVASVTDQTQNIPLFQKPGINENRVCDLLFYTRNWQSAVNHHWGKKKAVTFGSVKIFRLANTLIIYCFL